jgi:hypothetical protein
MPPYVLALGITMSPVLVPESITNLLQEISLTISRLALGIHLPFTFSDFSLSTASPSRRALSRSAMPLYEKCILSFVRLSLLLSLMGLMFLFSVAVAQIVSFLKISFVEIDSNPY